MKEFDRETAIRITAMIQSYAVFSAPVLKDPAGGVFLSAWDPADVLYIDNQPMSVFSTGKYFYDFQTEATDILGIYRAEITAVDVTFDGVKRELLFQLI